ncbi:MAG: DsbA family protein [Alphaproteobacteria bacterium GM7ARS4]|nr:DsbA family protein [Alphaproteobacteria bacterium GM7ARS4]
MKRLCTYPLAVAVFMVAFHVERAPIDKTSHAVVISLQEAHATIADTLEAMTEKVLGDPSAPVTLIEYASLTCGHCGNFHNNVLPSIQQRFIETKKVKLIYRDFPLDLYAVRASMLARCSGNERFFHFLKVLYQQQPIWTRAEDPLVALVRIANVGGINGDDFQRCVGNKGLEDAILQERKDGEKAYRINATPTLIIRVNGNDTKYEGPVTVSDLGIALEEAWKKSQGR